MSPLVYLLSIVGLDLLGLFFNIRMLLGCLRKENRYLTPWVICQFVFQVTILVAVTVDAWNKHVEESYEYCCLLKELQKTAVFLAVCNFAQLKAVSMDDPEHTLLEKIHTASPLKLVLATLGMTITNVAILWPLKRFIEGLVSYTSSATNLYIMLLNFSGLRMFFSGTRIKWTEPKENTLETERSLTLKELCGCSLYLTAGYLLLPGWYLVVFEISFEGWFPHDHYILMGFLNIVYGTFVPAFVTGPANIFTPKGSLFIDAPIFLREGGVCTQASLKETKLEMKVACCE